MSKENNGSGIIYPEILLGGKTYVVKFTRGAILYRLSKAGVDLAKAFTKADFAKMMDFLHAAICGEYPGTVEELADLVLSEGRAIEVGQVIVAALGKVFPPSQQAQVAVDQGAPEIQ